MPATEPAFVAADPRFESKVRESFARQRMMSTLGARLVRVAPGEVDVEVAHDERLVQQNGFLHAGALASVADSANGYAAFTLAPAGTDVLAVEFLMAAEIAHRHAATLGQLGVGTRAALDELDRVRAGGPTQPDAAALHAIVREALPGRILGAVEMAVPGT